MTLLEESNSLPAASVVYVASKRCIDVVSALIGLVVLSPLLFGIAIAVKLSSPGPVFYRGVRTGLHRRIFRIYKFRSMLVGADKGAGTTSKSDSRITVVGTVLRRYKLDELPQLLNVLVGDMSLVGPRPELPRYTEQYREEELLILTVKPGITDYASIEYSNLNDLISDEDPDRVFEEQILVNKNRLRVKYVKERGLVLDFYLILATLTKLYRQVRQR